jgi:cell division protein ZapA (FtsZ GTPase activity inhibitor)
MNSNEDMMLLTVWLAERSYRIRVKPEEETVVLQAVKIADDKIKELRTHYAGKDDQDFIAMCLLMYAADGATEPLSAPVREEIQKLTDRIQTLLPTNT